MPKPGSKEIYQRLHKQCTNLSIPTLPPTPPQDLRNSYDVILDAIFGFSFHPPVRAPFDTLITLLATSSLPIVSVDIPSGWDVERGPVELTRPRADGIGGGTTDANAEPLDSGVKWLNPDVLISLTAPKEGVRSFKGRHFLGGRFVSRAMGDKYELNLPKYPGWQQIVELPHSDSSQKL